MECNKEEAIRAKSIAENRMQSKDFKGARKVALKAQSLFPELDSISQILAVCHVHCTSAISTVGGTDWYGVLQVEMTADESTIRKQYRKLALLLHPDKNKLAGAESAFQQVGDAYKILSDPLKRSQYDMIRRSNFRGLSLNQAVRRPYRPSAKKQPGPGVSSTAAKSTFAHFRGLNQDNSTSFSCTGVFWAICPSCNIKLQYPQNVLSKPILCEKCFNSFVAYDFKAQGEPTTKNLKKDGNSVPLTVMKTESFCASNMELPRSKPDDSAFNQEAKLEDCRHEPNDSVRDCNVEDDSIHCNDVKFQKVQLQSVQNGEKVDKPPARQRNGKSNRTVEMSVDRTNRLRRSDRNKPNVIPDEVQDACIDSQPPASKRLRKGAKQIDTVQANSSFPGEIANGKREENRNSHMHAEFDAENFSKFEAKRCEIKFAVDQIWALYDDMDGMPRFYARVKKVYSRGFKLQLTWLEKDPRTISEMKWCEKGLPVACGSFKLGKSFSTEKPEKFSHLASWRKGTRRNSYVIYPRKGEVWALFSNWDVRWSSEVDSQRIYEYQVVEVISDFREVEGIGVVRLVKIKEFVALFVREADAEESLRVVPEKDVLMFSHRIPAFRMTGKEEDGVPEGAFELDCACLPTNFKVTMASVTTEATKSRIQNDGSVCDNISQQETENGFEAIGQNALEKSISGTRNLLSKKTNGASEMVNADSNITQHTSSVSQKDADTVKVTLRNAADNLCSQNTNVKHHSSPTCSLYFEYPESEFYDFESDRSMEKFECGQIWAFYCEIDKFPKYYGRIRVVDRKSNRVHVRWLGFYSAIDEDDYRCADDKPPPACGTFRAVKETCVMDSGETFSHLVKAKPMVTRDHYNIFPEVGEVWAVFRNWNAGWSANELRNAEFDIVEVSDSVASGIKGLLLTKVDGYVSVFRRENEGCDLVKLIPFRECFKFSHRIPAYQLLKEMGSSCYWELDPAAVPAIFLISKS